MKVHMFQFPEVMEGIFSSIDAISREAAKILHRPSEENGESLEKTDKLENGGGGGSVPDNDHHSLQGKLMLTLVFSGVQGKPPGLNIDRRKNSVEPKFSSEQATYFRIYAE
uniref:S ribonuclease n=1 Tax=Heterorhabditis bacteriophora TaxID=37862 RepID=A0A1I7X6Y2_HETBA